MLPVKFKNGNIIIPLICLLFLSSGVFMLAKYLASSQADVSASINTRYDSQIYPSASMEVNVTKWESYENSAYGYRIKFPKQWVSENSNPANGDENTYERFLGSRIRLKISVKNDYDFSPGQITAQFGKNSFLYNNKKEDTKLATVEHNKLFFIIGLTQNNYFPSDAEFSAAFNHILQNFEFTK